MAKRKPPTAQTVDDHREALRGRTAEGLATVLAELDVRHPDVEKRFARHALGADPARLATAFRMQLLSWKRSNNFYWRNSARGFGQELERWLDEIEHELLPLDAAKAHELEDAFVRSDELFFEQADDSDGAIGDAIRAGWQALASCRSRRPLPSGLSPMRCTIRSLHAGNAAPQPEPEPFAKAALRRAFTRAEYRQGSGLGDDRKHWFRARFFQQSRLFFRYHRASRLIVCAWVNDEDTKRAYESSGREGAARRLLSARRRRVTDMRNAFLIRPGVLLMIAMLAACETAPQAQPVPRPIASSDQLDARQRDLDNRVEQGYRDGRLTRDELVLLRRMSADIRREEQRYRTDNHLSPEERRTLSNKLDVFAREVSRQLGDTDRR